MKKTSFAFVITVLLVLCPPLWVHAQGGEADIGRAAKIAMPLLTSFFDALRDGDVDILKNCMGGELYENRRVLLEQNEGYPDFLRQLYRGVAFTVAEVAEEKNGDIRVDVAVEFEDGRGSVSRLLLSKNDLGVYEIVGISEE